MNTTNKEDTIHTDSFMRSETETSDAIASTEQAELGAAEPEADEQRMRIAMLEEELNSVRDQLYRRVADMENMRKRYERERLQLFHSSRIEAVKQFLAVNDDLLRTLSASEQLDVQPKSFLEGVQMVASKFNQVLSSYNVQLINEEGVPFDVNIHDALLRQPAPEGVGENIVLKVLEPGYKMGDIIIRHAKVIVTE
jgi:molecular chaperone GrpE